MRLPTLLTPNDQNGMPNNERQRQSEEIVFDVTQHGNAMKVEGGGIRVDFAVEGIELPAGADAPASRFGVCCRAP